MTRKERIGVFVCHCGNNIAGTVDVKQVVEELSHYPGVVHAEDYMYMCSDPGQELMRKAIREKAFHQRSRSKSKIRKRAGRRFLFQMSVTGGKQVPSRLAEKLL